MDRQFNEVAVFAERILVWWKKIEYEIEGGRACGNAMSKMHMSETTENIEHLVTSFERNECFHGQKTEQSSFDLLNCYDCSAWLLEDYEVKRRDFWIDRKFRT